jgi:hypothetical protein
MLGCSLFYPFADSQEKCVSIGVSFLLLGLIIIITTVLFVDAMVVGGYFLLPAALISALNI